MEITPREMEAKQQDLTKVYNEMIALWMGVKNVWVHPKLGVYEAEDETGYIDLVDVGIRSLDYHRDWNKLMPVVDKIDGMGYFVTIMRTRTTIAITLNVQNHIQSIHPGYSMIEVCYMAVVEFIKWHNSQDTSNQPKKQ